MIGSARQQHDISIGPISMHRDAIATKDIINQLGCPSPTTILQIYKQCVRPIFEYGIVFTLTVSEFVINKIQRVQNSFIRPALRLPKYVSASLIHEASGLPYDRETLITVGQNHLATMHANPSLSIQSTQLGPT